MNKRHRLSAMMAAVAALEGRVPPPPPPPPPAPPPSPGAWTGMALLRTAVSAMKAEEPTFGSSAADTTVTGTNTPTMYVDTVLGSPLYDGLAPVYNGVHGPKNVMPATTTAPNQFIAVLTGSTIVTNYQPNVATPSSVNQAFGVNHANCKVAAWSRKYNQEVRPTTPGFRNPFDWMLANGYWVDDTYLNDYFFKFSGNAYNVGYTRGSQGRAIGIGAAGFVVRGAWCDGHTHGLCYSTSSAYTAEDYYISRAYRPGEPGQANGVGDGHAFVHEKDDVPGCRLARGMTAPQSIGQDLFHSQPTVGGNGPQNATVTDTIWLHDCVAQTVESMHGDVWQMGHGPGNMVMQRVLIQHLVQDKQLPSVQGTGKSLPQGCAIMIPNGTNGQTYTAAPRFTDVLIASNTSPFNTGSFRFSGAITFSRFGCYLVRNQQFIGADGYVNAMKMINYTNTMTTVATDSHLWFINPHFTPISTAGGKDGYYTVGAASSITSGMTLH